MKLLVGLLIVMLVFLGFSIHTQQEVLTTTDAMRERIAPISKKINAEDWDSARQDTESMMKQWNTIQDRWDLFITHEDIDELEIILARLLSYITSKDDSSALAELAELDAKLGHIYRKELFNLQNVM